MENRRCAIYTRKSTEEGLDQEYNTLAAQRDACEAYIKSQAHEGWKAIRKHYDDGGFSGGNLARPAMKELLEDIARGRVDTVVVYKVDRLTRSLSDFAKIVDVFDNAGASFVAVTQHFNTTTSMGRLTLNVLLSFAQFEREVTGERIRDKIAASKKKGMWMGGAVPLGYDVEKKKLVVNEAEAERVRHIFERYVALGTVTALREELLRHNIRSKRRVSSKGKVYGGGHFSHGALYNILKNRTYRGEVEHKENIYPGEHKEIVCPEIWSQVREQIAKNRRRYSKTDKNRKPYLLQGILFDDALNPMSPTYAVKKDGQRYRYYVSNALTRRRRKRPGSVARIPAEQLDDIVKNRFSENGKPFDRDTLLEKVARITVCEGHMEFQLAKELSEPEARKLSMPGDEVSRNEDGIYLRILAQLRSRGGEKIIVGPNGESVVDGPRPNAVLIKNILQAHRFRKKLLEGTFATIQELADHENCSERYIRKVLPLAYIAPDITEAILHGNQSPGLELQHLVSGKLPLSWNEQRSFLLSYA